MHYRAVLDVTFAKERMFMRDTSLFVGHGRVVGPGAYLFEFEIEPEDTRLVDDIT